MGNKFSAPSTTPHVDADDTADMFYVSKAEESALLCRSPMAIRDDARSSGHFASPEAFYSSDRRLGTPLPPVKGYADVVVDNGGRELGDGDDLQNHEFQRDITKGIIKISSCNGGNVTRMYDGMAFLLQDGEHFYVYTTKHNFFDTDGNTVGTTSLHFPYNPNESWQLSSLTNRIPPKKELHCSELNIANFGFRNNHNEPVNWQYGFDVVRFPVDIKRQTAFDIFRNMKAGCYDAVPQETTTRSKKYERGMEIGIVVWGIAYNEDTVDNACVGEKEHIKIYRGEIICATTHTIETSYNSYHGCSGAPVLCIDNREKYEDSYGTVIAVHAGHPSAYKDKNIRNNVAFKITGNVLTAEVDKRKEKPMRLRL